MAVLKSAMDDMILASGRAHKEFISSSTAGPFVFVCSILRLLFIVFFGLLSSCHELIYFCELRYLANVQGRESLLTS